MSSGRDYMMDKWAEEYKLEQQRKEKQMAFEFKGPIEDGTDYEELREREVGKALEKSRGEAEYREWVEEKECND